MQLRPTLHSPASERGSSLIEVLVAILIFSLGLLGIAGLQAATAQFQLGVRHRTALAPLVSDIAGRVRNNAEQAGDNAVTGAKSTSAYVISGNWTAQQSATLTIAKNCETGTVTCTSEERAAYDITAWRMRLRDKLPQGAALLSGDRSRGFRVTIMWYDKDLSDKGRASDSTVIKSSVCSASDETAGMNRMVNQNCCPTAADAPEGVRCNQFSFLP